MKRVNLNASIERAGIVVTKLGVGTVHFMCTSFLQNCTCVKHRALHPSCPTCIVDFPLLKAGRMIAFACRLVKEQADQVVFRRIH